MEKINKFFRKLRIKKPRPRTKAFICIGVSIVYFLLSIFYLTIVPGFFNQVEPIKFIRITTTSIIAIGLFFTPLIIYSVYYRQLHLIMTWLIIQGILWQLNIILTVVILLTIVRTSNTTKTTNDAAVFIIYAILDIIWFLIGYGIWRYWKLLNDIKHFPLYERINLEIQGGRHIEPENIDFDSVSLQDFERLAAFGWRRGTRG